MNQTMLTQLIEKGVKIPNPESVYISEDVNLDRISGNGVILYSGTKLVGPRTLVLEKSIIGYEAPVTLENTLVGPDTRLNGGYFQDAVFLGRNQFGSSAHVRKGTILEEEANAAHCVGLKQTILFPFVTLGSLINFCDCLMAGGTSRKDHSEVGSSFIHFNYTPNQDKATPSMFGNVHQGVMLDQPPIFLGGQGGVVGPLRLGFGNITAAGSIVRKSEEGSFRLILGGSLKSMSVSWQPGVYRQVKPIIQNNIAYISGLLALRDWYLRVRPLFAQTPLEEALVRGLEHNIDACIQERIARFSALAEKLIRSREILTQKSLEKGNDTLDLHSRALEIIAKGKEIFEEKLGSDPGNPKAETFVREVEKGITRMGKNYINVIQGLPEQTKKQGSAWLKEIEETIYQRLEF